MNDKKEQDIRVIRSKAWLLDALFELLNEKEYRNISIKELTDEACVARQTFYRNYKSIDDILLDNLDEVFNKFFSRIKDDIDNNNTVNGIGIILLQTCLENRKLFIALHKTELIHQTIERFSVYSHAIQKLLGLDTNIKTTRDDYLTYFIAGGTYTILHYWFSEMKSDNIDEISQMYDKIIKFHTSLLKP